MNIYSFRYVISICSLFLFTFSTERIVDMIFYGQIPMWIGMGIGSIIGLILVILNLKVWE